jgi:hypothetical protein
MPPMVIARLPSGLFNSPAEPWTYPRAQECTLVHRAGKHRRRRSLVIVRITLVVLGVVSSARGKFAEYDARTAEGAMLCPALSPSSPTNYSPT